MNLIILIISNDYYPYNKFKELWRGIKLPIGIELFFVEARKNEAEVIEVVGDTIYVNGSESLIPGIWFKQKYAMQWLLSNKSFDYMLRSNLSSLYDFDALNLFLADKPKENIICGSIMYIPLISNTPSIESDTDAYNKPTVFGCGYIMTRDIVEYMVKWDSDDVEYLVPDDIVLGYMIESLKPILYPMDVEMYRDRAQKSIYIRFKSDNRADDILRMKEKIEESIIKS